MPRKKNGDAPEPTPAAETADNAPIEFGDRVKLEVKPGDRIPRIGEDFKGIGLVVTSFPENIPPDPNIIIDLYKHQPWQALDAETVDYRPENTDYHHLGIDDPDHPYGPKEVGPEQAAGDCFPMMGITDAIQALGNYGAGDVLFTIGDTGCDPTHSYQRDKAHGFWSATGPERDGHGHGTHTDSTATKALGIASDATAWMFQSLDGPSGSGSESGVANSIRAAADKAVELRVRAAVLSLSLGGSHSSVINAAAQYAQQRRVLCVCAAGNDGPGAAFGSPADAPDTIIVGAIDRNYRVAPFSSGGTTAAVTCYAPGVDVVAAAADVRNGGATVQPGFDWHSDLRAMSGTSMATPHVAGACMLLLASGMEIPAVRAYINSHQHPITDANGQAPRNGKGCLFLKADFGQTPPPPGNGGGNGGGGAPPAPPSKQDVLDNLDEAIHVLDEARNTTRGVDNDKAWSDIGAVTIYLHGVRDWVAGLPEVETPPPPPPPPPAPKLTPGEYKGTYGTDPRQYMRVIVPNNARGIVCILWHGGGWLQGDPYVAIPAEWKDKLKDQNVILPEQVNTWFQNLGIIMVEPAYRLGNVGNCIEDAAAATRWVYANIDRIGGDRNKIFLGGHSAGGHLAWMVALSKLDIPVPAGVFSLAGAGLAMNDQTHIPSQNTAQIFNQSWPHPWQQWSPDTHVTDRTGAKPHGVVIQGTADDQLDPNWAVMFVTAAKRAGLSVDLVMEQGGTHFSVADPSSNAQTAQALRGLFGI